MIIIFYILILLVLLNLSISFRQDCCSSNLNNIGQSCEITTYSGNDTFYCVEISDFCPQCQLKRNITSLSCFQCCITNDPDVCGIPFSFVSPNSWSLIFVIFAGSFFCCSIVFLSAEQNRGKEGLSFREAYLLPIPVVSTDLEYGNKDYRLPPDQLTAIGREHSSLHIPVAEPTEYSSLISVYYHQRDSRWE